MEKFSAVVFYSIGRYLPMVRHNFQAAIDSAGNSRSTLVAVGSGEFANNTLRVIKTNCESIGLSVSAKCVAHILTLRNTEGSTLGNLMDAITHLTLPGTPLKVSDPRPS